MKCAFTIILLVISLSAFSQQLPKQDSVKLSFTVPQVQFIYQAINSQHGDHVEITKLLDYIAGEATKQLQTKADSTSKKRP